MSNDPEQIRRDIERTRASLSRDVDALEEKVSPSAILDRKTARVRGAVGSLKDRVMGAADNAGTSVSGAAHGTTGTAHDLADRAGDQLHSARDATVDAAHQVGDAAAAIPGQVRRGTEGNPLAAGLIAFGVGWLASSLLPASQKERDLARQVEEQAQPLVDEVRSVASEAADHLKEPAQEAVAAVKDTAQEAGQHLAEEGRHEAESVKEDASSAAGTVRDEAKDNAEHVRDEA